MDVGITIIALAILGAVTYLAGLHVLPSEAAASVYGAMTTAVVVVIQKNTFKAAYQTYVKESNSIQPPPYKQPVISFSTEEPDTKKEGRSL